MDKVLNINDIKRFKDLYEDNKNNKLLANAVQKNGVLACAYNSAEATKMSTVFNVEVKDMVSVTNQKQSGRCWMFAGLNVIRKILVKNLGVKDLELSETYLFFYDKLEKANNKLEKAIEFVDEGRDSRIFQSIFDFGPDADGGYWHQFKDLVKKYGIVPLQNQPECYSSTKSAEMDAVLKVLVSKAVDTIVSMKESNESLSKIRDYKESVLSDVYKVLAMCLGTPVDSFTFDYKKDNSDKENNEAKIVSITTTPLDFFNDYVKEELDDYIVLVNFPSEQYPFYKKYKNIGASAMYCSDYFVLNVPMADFKSSAIKALKDQNPLWFACDVSAASFRTEGILSTEVCNVEELFGIDLKYDKYESVRFRSTSCNHAMTLTGVNLVDSFPNRWKVQNSWGKDFGKDGFFVMSDAWFDRFVYQVVVNKKYLSENVLKALDTDSIELKPWEQVA